MSGGPMAGDATVAGLAPLEITIGEGRPSGCVGMMPSAASKVVRGGVHRIARREPMKTGAGPTLTT
eukprot:2355416-Alexandrium_andersonii.AAC.1